MPENNEMNTVAVETATEAVTEAVQNAPATTDKTFSTQYPFLTAIGTTAAMSGAVVFGVWVAGKLCDGADKLAGKLHNWRQNRKAKKATKNDEPIEVVNQEEDA